MSFIDLKLHLIDSQDDYNHDVTYLFDYSIFGEKLTGLDIVRELKLDNVYLITDYAEDIKLQDDLKNLTVKLVPKAILKVILNNQRLASICDDSVL
jgi:hypothetical protein